MNPITMASAIEIAIIEALREIGRPATAFDIERHPAVAEACRRGKLKARHRLVMLTAQRRIHSDMAEQRPIYWVDQSPY